MSRMSGRGAFALLFTCALALSLRAAPLPGESPGTALSLEEAVRRAGSGSASVRAAASLVESAQRKVWVAATAFAPTITASATGAWLANPPKGMTVSAGSLGTLPLLSPISASPNGVYSGPFVLREFPLPTTDLSIVPDAKDTYFKGNVTLSQPLFTWGKVVAGFQLAELEARIATLNLAGSRLDAERDAKRCYDAALLARDSASIIGELRDLAKANAADAESAYAAGTTTRAAVLQAEAQLSDLEARLVEVEEGGRSALAGLAIVAGLGTQTLELSSQLLLSAPTVDEDKVLAAALASSVDRGNARSRLSEAARRLDLERGSAMLLPDLAAFASLDASGQTVPFSQSDWADSTWSWDLTVGVQAQVKAFDGGASFAKIAAAQADLAAAKVGVEGSEDAVRMAVRDGVAALRKAAASVASKTAHAAWAAEALRSAKASFDAGVLGRPDFNAAAMMEAGARLDLIAARYTLSEAVADLERLAGGQIP